MIICERTEMNFSMILSKRARMDSWDNYERTGMNWLMAERTS